MKFRKKFRMVRQMAIKALPFISEVRSEESVRRETAST